jgi:hypothetical protein
VADTEEKVEVVFTEPFKYAYGGRYVVEYTPSDEPVAVSARCAEVAIELGVAREPGAEGEGDGEPDAAPAEPAKAKAAPKKGATK